VAIRTVGAGRLPVQVRSARPSSPFVFLRRAIENRKDHNGHALAYVNFENEPRGVALRRIS
jgi:hypothetical protein